MSKIAVALKKTGKSRLKKQDEINDFLEEIKTLKRLLILKEKMIAEKSAEVIHSKVPLLNEIKTLKGRLINQVNLIKRLNKVTAQYCKLEKEFLSAKNYSDLMYGDRKPLRRAHKSKHPSKLVSKKRS